VHIVDRVEIYGNTCASSLEKLQELDNRILKLQLKGARTNLLKLYYSYETLPVDELHLHLIVGLVNKYVYSREKIPGAYAQYFIINSSVYIVIRPEAITCFT
jgi:hypothetical protein